MTNPFAESKGNPAAKATGGSASQLAQICIMAPAGSPQRKWATVVNGNSVKGLSQNPAKNSDDRNGRRVNGL